MIQSRSIAAAARRANGYEVSYRGVSITGFPGSAVLAIDGLEVGKPSDALAWHWIPGRVRITAGAAGSRALTISLAGTQSLTYRIGGETRTAQFTARRFRVELQAKEDGTLGRLAVDLSEFALLRPQEGPPVIARRVEFQLARGGGDGVLPMGTEASMLFDTLVLPEHRIGPMGDTIDSLEAKFRLLTKVSSLDIAAALADWRGRGGKLTIVDSRLRWAGLSARAKGWLQVDEAFRPAGALSADIEDFRPTLEAFWAAGRFNTQVMNSMIAALAEIREIDGVGIVPYDIRIEDGVIRVDDIFGHMVEGATLGTVVPIFGFPPLPD